MSDTMIMDDEDAIKASIAKCEETRADESIRRDRDGEDLIAKCCSELGVTERDAIDLIEWAEENLSTKKNSQYNGTQQRVMMEKLFRYLIESSENLWLEIRAFAYLLELDDIIGHSCPADWARQADCSRANATKTVKKIQDAFHLPARNGQKSLNSRLKSSLSRKKHLK